MKPNHPINTASEKRRAFGTATAAYGERWA